MAYSVAATVTAAQARLQAAGYSAWVDPSRVNPPGIWISPRTITDRTLDGGGSVVLWLYLIAPNTETTDALLLLDDLLHGLDDLDLAAHDTDPDVDLTAAVLLPDGGAPLPAFRLAVTTDLLETAP